MDALGSVATSTVAAAIIGAVAGDKPLQVEVGTYRILTSSDPLPYHSALDWTNETQHVFRDTCGAPP